jgi:quinoprotein glucose dehydrogenase
MKTFAIDDGLVTALWAAEPMLANPVALCIDHRGRVFVAETYRQEEKGVPDNRSFSYWKDDDLKSQTLSDRRAMYLTHRPHFAMQFTEHHDRIVLLEDRNGDGAADRSVVFADGFNDILDGTGAGVLARGQDLYYTCIPNLWRLRDGDDDCVADKRTILSTGYGIRIALRGHDSHGLTIGPDGRLYFSIGDRGYNIWTDDGRNLKCPWAGAVFRCELDGSGLEVYATGLRNPQELAFDDFGNLFTGDNNSDSEDRARIVYVVEGGETGWRMNFQYVADRGGWVAEGWWKTRFPGQAAFHIPPLAHIGSGPSGFTFYPGTGLPDRYAGTFFLCDFLGSPQHSGVRSFKVRPEGAGFEVVDAGKFIWNVLATDADFGPDGTFYVADWVEGWMGAGKGRIYTVASRDAAARASGVATGKLLAEDFGALPEAVLVERLGHPDRRVRQEAQLALAARDEEGARALVSAALGSGPVLQRVHALWGLGQVWRRDKARVDPRLLDLVADGDPEIRAQAIRVLGEAVHVPAHPLIRARLEDPSLRVRYFAALNLGRFRDARDVVALLDVARENTDRDLFLRHGVVMGLVGAAAGSADALTAHGDDGSAAVRLALVLALRRLGDPCIVRFLDDADGYVATEAARAVYDVPIAAALPALARTLTRVEHRSIPFVRRALAATELEGSESGPERVAAFADREDAPVPQRVEALSILLDWSRERDFDRILNMWRPRTAGTKDAVVRAVGSRVRRWLSHREGGMVEVAAALAARYGLTSALPDLETIVRDAGAPSGSRRAALDALAALDASSLGDAIKAALASGDGALRGRAAALLATISKDEALRVIAAALEDGSVAEQQIGLLTLARLDDPRADLHLLAGMDRLLSGEQPKDTWLELLEAARARSPQTEGLRDRIAAYERTLDATDPLSRYYQCLAGGDPRRGRRVFFEKTETSCRRCHQIGDLGPTDATVMAGPDLTHIGSKRDASYLLRSLVAPNAEVAEGFAAWLIETKDSDVYRGRILSENAEEIVLEVIEVGEAAELITVKKAAIVYRGQEKSAMPEDLVEKLTPQELRDLVAFLVAQQ